MLSRLFDLRLTPLAMVVIVSATAVPVELRAAHLGVGAFEWKDFIQNLLLFAPFGIALHRRPLHVVLLASLCLSLAVELLQIWQFERFPSHFDLVANVAGALLAAGVGRRVLHADPVLIPVTACLSAGCVLGSTLILAIWYSPVRTAAIADWQSNYTLILGNETSGDRPWSGEINELSIWDRSLSPLQIPLANENNVAVEALLFRTLRARERKDAAPTVLPASVAQRVANRIIRSGAFTIAARIRTDDLTQSGPARIVSFSQSTLARNFDLGQIGEAVVFRVRTDVSGLNGQHARAETDSVLSSGTNHDVVATYDGAVARIYVDGEARGRSNLAAQGCRVAALCDSALPIAWTLLGMASAILAATLLRDIHKFAMFGVCLFAGSIPLVADKFMPLMPHGIPVQPWIPFCSLLGALAVGVAHSAHDHVNEDS
jgi:hypothetical protein